MSRFEGVASIRRALSMPNGDAQLDVRPAGLNWQWSTVPADRARQALACGLAAISGGWKLYLSLPDDPASDVLEIIGLSRTRDYPPGAMLYESASGIGDYDLAVPVDEGFAFDYDGSGKLDHLVFYRPGAGTIWFLRNDGGTFTPVNKGETITTNYDLADPRDRAFAYDYNSNGKLDHLVLYRPGATDCRIFRNDAGTFTPVYSGSGIGGYDLWGATDRGFAFDYSSSGKLDHLLFYRPGEGYLWILRNKGGVFTAVNQGETITTNYDLADPRDRAFAYDYNSNGKLDHLVLYRPGATDCRIFRNDAGTFTPVYSGSGIGGYDLWGATDRGFAFDYGNVGKLDHLVFYRPGEGYLWILRNDRGTFTPVPGYSGSGLRGYDMADPRDRAFAFDYDSNGRQDNLVLYRPGTGMIWITNSLV